MLYDPRYRGWYADCADEFLRSESRHSNLGSHEHRTDGYFSPTLTVSYNEVANHLTRASVTYCKIMMDNSSKFPVGVLVTFIQADTISAAMRKAMKAGRGGAQSGEAYIVDIDGLLVTPLCLSVALCLTMPHWASPLTGINCSIGFAGGCNVKRFLGVHGR